MEIARGQDWELGVTREFKKIVAEHPDFIPILYQIIENNEELKELGVRVIPFQAGFTEKFSDKKHTFFVSEWKKDNWVSLKDKMWPENYENLDEKDKAELQALQMRLDQIKSVLETKCGFIDIHEVNAFYDIKTKEIILYDLSQKKQST